jgi:uncharacterized membrane protein YdjX (TVP38/TMEM64 family)
VPLLLLAAAVAAFWLSGAGHALNWATLSRHSAALRHWVNARPVLAPFTYVVLYTIATALSVPEAAVITVAGGFLFGALAGGICAVLGATAGSIILFLAARSAFAAPMARKGGRVVQTIRAGLQRDGFSYLLAIRLIPVFPFWLVNIGAALGGMRLLPYAAATLIGILPGTFVFAWIGAGIGDVLAGGGTPDLTLIFSPRILGPMVALALLSLLPVFWRRWKRASG